MGTRRNPLRPIPKQSCRFIQRMVRLCGRVHHGLAAQRGDSFIHGAREMVRQRQCHPAEIGLVAATGERASKNVLPSDTLGDPAHGLPFDLRRELRTCQGRKLRIQRRDHGFSDEAHISGRGIHEAKIVGAGNMKTPGHHVFEDLFQYSCRIVSLLRECLVQRSVCARG